MLLPVLAFACNLNHRQVEILLMGILLIEMYVIIMLIARGKSFFSLHLIFFFLLKEFNLLSTVITHERTLLIFVYLLFEVIISVV